MKLIFSQPVLIDPDVGDDETFWFLLWTPFSGYRIEETAQLRPPNIRAEKNIAFVAIERDRIADRRKITVAGDWARLWRPAGREWRGCGNG